MTPEELHRAVLTATALGDDEQYAKLRERFDPHDHRGEFEHLEGAAAACLEYRLGEAAQWDRTAPTDRAELARFMVELRTAGPEYWLGPGPPSNLLEVEGIIRGLRGERHFIAETGGNRMRFTFQFLVRYLTATIPDIHDDFDTIVDQAREHIMQRLMG